MINSETDENGEETFRLSEKGAVVVSEWLILLEQHGGYDLTPPEELMSAAAFLVARGHSKFNAEATAVLLSLGMETWERMKAGQV